MTTEPGTGPRPLTRLDSVEPVAGDPACWLSNVCPQCGAFNETPPGTPCWHCGRTDDAV